MDTLVESQVALKTRAYAAKTATTSLAPWSIERREPGHHDVLIDILYCGVCHSDVHQARDEWGNSIFPMVPGHEIIGRVSKVGDKVKKWKPGQIVGVGCFVDSCRRCEECRAGEEQLCEPGMTLTYNGYERDGKDAERYEAPVGPMAGRAKYRQPRSAIRSSSDRRLLGSLSLDGPLPRAPGVSECRARSVAVNFHYG
jgi:Zn-dependent alcohol dehydrogenase